MKRKLSTIFSLLFWLTTIAQTSNVCMTRLHHGYAEVYIRADEWLNNENATLKFIVTEAWLHRLNTC